MALNFVFIVTEDIIFCGINKILNRAAHVFQNATQQLCLMQVETAGDWGRQLSSILTTKAIWNIAIVSQTSRLHCNYSQYTFTSGETTRGGTVRAWNRVGGMKCLVVWLSHAFVWYFPRKPIKDSSLSRWWKCGSSGGWSDGFPPQLLFQQHSLSHSSASLCNLFEYAFMHICCLMGAACWQILAWKTHTLISQYFFFFFNLAC